MTRARAALLIVTLGAGCGKKSEPTANPPDAAVPTEAAASCLRAHDAHVSAWRSAPPELALEVDLEWTCKPFIADDLELTDAELGAKLGEQKRKERYRIDPHGDAVEWEDFFAPLAADRARALFVYSVSTTPPAAGIRYGIDQLVPRVVLGPAQRTPPPPPTKPTVRIVSWARSQAKGTASITALLEVSGAPRAAGYPQDALGRKLTLQLDNDAHSDRVTAEADRVLDVDEKLAPLSPPELRPFPAKRLVLVETAESKATKLWAAVLKQDGVTLALSAAASSEKPTLVLPRETRARLQTIPRSDAGVPR